MKLIHVFSLFDTAESFFDGQFKYLADQGHEIVVVASDDSETETFCKRNDVRFVPALIPRNVSPLALTKAVNTLCKLIRQENADAVFGHTPVGALCAMTAAWICGVKNRVYYRHGVIYTTMRGLKRRVFVAEEKFVASLSTAIVNVSHSLSKLAVRDGLNSAGKQYVIGHGTCGGIDAKNLFNPELIDGALQCELKKSLCLEESDVVFGFCGRICKDKGILELVDAFDLFKEKHPELSCKLLLIGDYDTRDGLDEEMLFRIKNNDNIIVTGKIDKKQIPYYYSMLDVFVFPSHREGFGMCVLEASAMEKPILDSRSHGCEDAIVEHETGEYVDLTPEGICAGMELMIDSDLRHMFGVNGRKMVLNWYDSTVMWPLVKSLYEEILK